MSKELENYGYKKKYDSLRCAIQDLFEKIDMQLEEYAPSENRAFVQSNRVYVNFDLEVVSNESYAKKEWGEGNYDVYDLNRELSPVDQENPR